MPSVDKTMDKTGELSKKRRYSIQLCFRNMGRGGLLACSSNDRAGASR